MTTIPADVALLPGAKRDEAPAARASWGRIVGYTLLAAAGLFFGLIAGVFLVLATGLIALC